MHEYLHTVLYFIIYMMHLADFSNIAIQATYFYQRAASRFSKVGQIYKFIYVLLEVLRHIQDAEKREKFKNVLTIRPVLTIF